MKHQQRKNLTVILYVVLFFGSWIAVELWLTPLLIRAMGNGSAAEVLPDIVGGTQGDCPIIGKEA